MAGVFTITGGTDDFRKAKGRVYVEHKDGMSHKQLQVWY